MKKLLKFLLYFIICLLFVFSTYAIISGRTYLFKAVYYNFADIDDYKIFTNNTVGAGQPQSWPISTEYNQHSCPDSLTRLLEKLQTIGLLVIRNDSLFFEKYWEGYSDSSLSNSFSVAKSITSLLIGAALKEGKIKSVDEPVADFLPEFNDGLAKKLRIKDLLTMSSGSDWDESYANPLSITTEAYYGSDIHKTAVKIHIVKEPGTLHSYKSGDTELLGLIVEKATGKSLAEYASEKLWKPMGAEHAALWSTDHENGNEKAYCCFNTNARDFARIGQLMLDSGKWNGTAIIDSDYYRASITPCNIPDATGSTCNYYGYQWWLRPAFGNVFYARGILGQYIIVVPSKKMIIVRLGKKRSVQRINGAPAEVDALINWGLSLP
jgi:CubicO group peptidase (beta-lactamase class C family)